MKRITAQELKDLMESNSEIFILDVRDEEDYKKGHIKGAVSMAINEVSHEIEDLVEDKDSSICVYCYSGNRSAKVAAVLEFLDYTNIYNLGGIDNWKFELEMN